MSAIKLSPSSLIVPNKSSCVKFCRLLENFDLLAFLTKNIRFPNDSVNILTDRKSTRLNSSHHSNSYAVFCLKQKSMDLGRGLDPGRRQPEGATGPAQILL